MELDKNNANPDVFSADSLWATDIDVQRVCYEFLVFRDNGYLAATAPPPFGPVKFEVLRQVLTFAIPVAGLLAVWFVWGDGGLSKALPVALLVGYFLDKNLMDAIKHKTDCAMSKTIGDYWRVKELCIRLKVPQSELTEPRIMAAATLFLRRAEQICRDYLAAQDQRAEELKRTRIQRATFAASLAAGAVAAHATGPSDYSEQYSSEDYAPDSSYDDDHHAYHSPEPDYSSAHPWVNVNGLPMIDDTPLDVMGNTYGTGVQSFDSF